ncbi:tail fiber assembly protein [Pseudomonas frederiksbergensis]|uniref:tail fiber assembly protein n=1 Tax=Pseudomonas frederiksbergensis TaxID=104087 RepID=UPI003D1CFC16
MKRIVELDQSGRFVSDFIEGIGLPTPNNWTADICPDGFFAGRYAGSRSISGEWVKGIWVDDKALSDQELADLEYAQLVNEAMSKVDRLLQQAALRIAPLQDAVDIDEETEEEAVQLKAWKKYRVSLSRLSEQQGYPQAIEWPVTPT